ncbi:hypothetical protein PFISCL1PPCAC_6241, partial [Pristionchus fissidentatus]
VSIHLWFLRYAFLIQEILRVNTINQLELIVRERIHLRITALSSCPRVELFVGSGREGKELSRLTFFLNNQGLDRVDVDSPDVIPPPPNPFYRHECDFTSTVSLNTSMEVMRKEELVISTDKSQRFTRPRSPDTDAVFSTRSQFRSCCVVEFLMEL